MSSSRPCTAGGGKGRSFAFPEIFQFLIKSKVINKAGTMGKQEVAAASLGKSCT